MSRSSVSTHILDTMSGRPASGISVELLAAAATADDGWSPVASGISDVDGRVNGLGPVALPAGSYRLRFDTGAYFAGRQLDTFFPEVVVTFSENYSHALQQTLFEMGKKVLVAHTEIDEIKFSMPNNHHFLVDLSPFGLDNPNEVFFASDRPYGLIEATVLRDDASDAGNAWQGIAGFC